MKSNNITEYRAKTKEELNLLLSEGRKYLASTKIKLSLEKEKNLRALKQKREEIAVIKTLIREKEMEALNG